MHPSLVSFIKKRFHSDTFTGLPLTILVAVGLIIIATFAGITNSVVNSPAVTAFDIRISTLLFQGRSPFLTQVFSTITNSAGQLTIAILLAVTLAYLWLKKELAYLYALLIIVAGTELSVYLIKILIDRARPGGNIAYFLETTKSFPSGHSAIAVAFWGFITYYLLRHTWAKKKKSILFTIGTLLVLLIGFSRIYLGEHYLSDVLGGFLVGGLWLIVGIIFREQHFYTASIKKGVAV